MYWMLSTLPLLLRTLPLPARLIFWMLATLAGVRWTLTVFGFSCADGHGCYQFLISAGRLSFSSETVLFVHHKFMLTLGSELPALPRDSVYLFLYQHTTRLQILIL